MTDLRLTVGDTAPALSGTVNADLTGATAVVNLQRPDGSWFSHPATITDATTGAWRMPWATDDLSQPGTWHFELEVTFANGARQTFSRFNNRGQAAFLVRKQIDDPEAGIIVPPGPGVGERLTALEEAFAGGAGGSRRPTVTASGDTTGATDRAALQAAINAAYDSGKGGEVTYGPGLWINAPVVLKRGVTFRALGGTWSDPSISLADNANCHMVITDQSEPAYYIRMVGGVLDGRREHNPTGGNGVHLDSLEGVSPAFGGCSFNVIENVTVQYVQGTGFYAEGGQIENRYLHCYAFSCMEYGFHHEGSDTWFEFCTSGESGSHGFRIAGLGDRLNGCKSWWSGRINAVRQNSNPGVGNATAYGYNFIGSQNIQVTNCEAQDSAGPGVLLDFTSGYVQMHLDSNGAAFSPDQRIAGYVRALVDAHVELTVGTGTGRTQSTYPLHITDAADRNLIRVIANDQGCLYPDQLRPGSVVNPGNNLILGVGSDSGGTGLPDGGTTGQVLTKASNTNGDASWATPSGGGGGTTEYRSGRRDVTGVIRGITELAAMTGVVGLERIGDQVTWTFYGNVWDYAYESYLDIPAGFRPRPATNNSVAEVGVLCTNGGNTDRVLVARPSSYYAGQNSLVIPKNNAQALAGTITYRTGDATPSSLPGTSLEP